jgi:hypothetical protein
MFTAVVGTEMDKFYTDMPPAERRIRKRSHGHCTVHVVHGSTRRKMETRLEGKVKVKRW